jgi:hypothetical protein
MAIIVSALGVAIVLLGAVGVASPRRLIGLVGQWDGPGRFRLAIVIRVLLGVALLAVAPACRIPVLVQLIGVVSIVVAFSLLLAGRARMDTVVEWWLTRPELVRAAALLAVAFGALLIYAGA